MYLCISDQVVTTIGIPIPDFEEEPFIKIALAKLGSIDFEGSP